MLKVECGMWNSDLLSYKIDMLISKTIVKLYNNWKHDYFEESLGQLVLLGFDIAVFTPAAYLRRRLQRPSMEFSSCGWLRT